MAKIIKSNRLPGSSKGNQIDNKFAELEADLAELFGVPIDTAIAAALFEVVAGGLKKVIFQDAAGDPTAIGQLLRDGIVYKYHDGEDVQTLARLVDIPSVAGTLGLFGSIGQRSLNNVSTPNALFDLNAEKVMLTYSAGGNLIVVVTPVNPITINVATPGPIINGRDQAAAFSASSWINFYWIWNDTTSTLAGIASATAPEAGGPVMPTGYKYWSWAGAVRFNGANQLVPTYIFGNRAFYPTRQAALAAGVEIVETSVDVSALVPPNALTMELNASVINPDTTANDLKIRFVSGSDFYVLNSTLNNSSVQRDTASISVPNIGQEFLYLITAIGSANVWVTGYTLPNRG